MYTIIYSFLSQEFISIPFDDGHVNLKPESTIIFSIENDGEEAGKIHAVKRKDSAGEELEKVDILRRASENDFQKIEQANLKAQAAQSECIEMIKKFDLDMHIVSAKYSIDTRKLEFSFIAPNRVDFRELLKELVKHFKTKIRLKQIGPRDRAQMVEGFGKCGRRFCCCSFLHKIPPVTMEAARNQNIAHKSTDKLSGGCGKLLCCLNYEVSLYEDLKKTFPQVGTKIKYKREKAEIIGIDILNNKVKIRTEHNDTIMLPVDEIKRPKRS